MIRAMKNMTTILLVAFASSLMTLALPGNLEATEKGPSDKPNEKCEINYRNCVEGYNPPQKNPYAEVTCQADFAGGSMSPKEMKKCKAWCAEQRRQCEIAASEKTSN